jgi:hypothetical protein
VPTHKYPSLVCTTEVIGFCSRPFWRVCEISKSGDSVALAGKPHSMINAMSAAALNLMQTARILRPSTGNMALSLAALPSNDK